jgi:hypothetical protein
LLKLKNKINMKYLKSPSNKTYIQWNVTSGSGFFSIATQNDELYPSGSEQPAGKFITVSYFSGSLGSGNPVGQSIFQWENQAIKNTYYEEITKEEYDTFLANACSNIQTNW